MALAESSFEETLQLTLTEYIEKYYKLNICTVSFWLEVMYQETIEIQNNL